jgi:hypothetical protein
MTNLEKPLDFPAGRLSRLRGLRSVGAVRTAVLLALLIAYGVAFAALYPLVQTSVARSAAEGNDPMVFTGL